MRPAHRHAYPAGQGRDAMGHTTGIDCHDIASPIDAVLHRLDAVRQTGADRWIARCPAHDDRTPSLSLRETSDGTVLMRCWAGCSAADVVTAVGLSLADLFPRRLDHHREPIRQRDRWNPRDLLALIRREVHIVLVVASDIRAGIVPTDDDMARLGHAVDRISTAADEAARLDGTPTDEMLAITARRLGGV